MFKAGLQDLLAVLVELVGKKELLSGQWTAANIWPLCFCLLK